MSLLANNGGGFLYEKLPQFFPENQMTDTEAALWGLYYEQRKIDNGN